jgi:CRISPR-associated protein Csb1
MNLDYPTLREAVAGGAVALRLRTELTPVGGPDDKFFPPTYGVEESASTKYAVETQTVDGREVKNVIVDSVASQANRLELALRDGWEAGELRFPNAYVDFTVDAELADLGRISVLDAPHRITDAIFRDSLLDGTLFRLSDAGRAVTEARPESATGMFVHAPTALLFGVWDSTGPKGGLGAKFQRAISSEITAFDVSFGVKTASRIDPLAIEKSAALIYQAAEPEEGWVLDPQAAKQDKGKPVVYSGKGQGEKGRPSMINHGNVTPTIESRAGGVRAARIEQVAVISFAALRRLRFPVDASGSALEGDQRRQAEVAARTAIAALGVAALAYHHELDYDLRSRCLLIPKHPLRMELIGRDGTNPLEVGTDRSNASRLLEQAAQEAAGAGLPWSQSDLRLLPSPKLIKLIKLSRRVIAEEPGAE